MKETAVETKTNGEIKKAAVAFLRSCIANSMRYQRYGGLSLFDHAKRELDPGTFGAVWGLVAQAMKAARAVKEMSQHEVLAVAARLIEDEEVEPSASSPLADAEVEGERRPVERVLVELRTDLGGDLRAVRATVSRVPCAGEVVRILWTVNGITTAFRFLVRGVDHVADTDAYPRRHGALDAWVECESLTSGPY